MEFLESMSFTYALLYSGLAALLISIGPGLLVFRRRRRLSEDLPEKPAAPVVAAVNSYAEAPAPEVEIKPEMIEKMESVIGRIEASVGSCLEYCGTILEQDVDIIPREKIERSTGSTKDLLASIKQMQQRGMVESTIAGRLNIDHELLKLYMHAGGNRAQA